MPIAANCRFEPKVLDAAVCLKVWVSGPSTYPYSLCLRESGKDSAVITLDAAREIARLQMQTLGQNLTLFEEPIASGDYGWVFSFQSSAYVETNDLREALFGNAPLLVDRKTGSVFALGTANSVEKNVLAYQRFGDPHAEAGPTLELVNWRTGAEKILATKLIKTHTQLGLRAAKEAVDDCLSGRKPVVKCADAETAEVLVAKLDAVGFEASQLANSG